MEVLTSDENRPRPFSEDGALVTVLRGINLNPDAAPDGEPAVSVGLVTDNRDRHIRHAALGAFSASSP